MKKRNLSLEKRKFLKGFTLVELLITMTVIGVLTSLALVSYQGSRKTARDAKRKADLEQIRSALEMYRTDNGAYPTGGAGSNRPDWILNTGVTDEHPLGILKDEGYLAVVPIDPGLNACIDGCPPGDCGKAQFYSYRSDAGITYKLQAVEETSGFDDCLAECTEDWGDYQYCVSNP